MARIKSTAHRYRPWPVINIDAALLVEARPAASTVSSETIVHIK